MLSWSTGTWLRQNTQKMKTRIECLFTMLLVPRPPSQCRSTLTHGTGYLSGGDRIFMLPVRLTDLVPTVRAFPDGRERATHSAQDGCSCCMTIYTTHCSRAMQSVHRPCYHLASIWRITSTAGHIADCIHDVSIRSTLSTRDIDDFLKQFWTL